MVECGIKILNMETKTKAEEYFMKIQPPPSYAPYIMEELIKLQWEE